MNGAVSHYSPEQILHYFGLLHNRLLTAHSFLPCFDATHYRSDRPPYPTNVLPERTFCPAQTETPQGGRERNGIDARW